MDSPGGGMDKITRRAKQQEQDFKSVKDLGRRCVSANSQSAHKRLRGQDLRSRDTCSV